MPGTKPLPEPILSYQRGLLAFTWGHFHRKYPRYHSLKWFGIIYLSKVNATSPRGQWVDTLMPRQNGRLFPDNIFKWIFLNENVWILIRIPLKFVPRGPINNIPALVQIMAWHRPDDKPLSKTMVSLPTHIYVTQLQWVLGHNNSILAGAWHAAQSQIYDSIKNYTSVQQASPWYM